MMDPAESVESLDVERCRHLLRANDLGRIAIRDGDGVDIFPINYLVFDDQVYFRSAPGSKLAELTSHPHVAFEADGRTAGRNWSVVVHGVARRLNSDDEIERSGIDRLQARHPSAKYNYVAIRPDSISGREFFSARRSWSLRALAIAGIVVVAAVAALGVTGQLLNW